MSEVWRVRLGIAGAFGISLGLDAVMLHMQWADPLTLIAVAYLLGWQAHKIWRKQPSD